ncbi:MAG: hypothetical protein AAGI88_03060 [Pseudomonadota bacterium]
MNVVKTKATTWLLNFGFLMGFVVSLLASVSVTAELHIKNATNETLIDLAAATNTMSDDDQTHKGPFNIVYTGESPPPPPSPHPNIQVFSLPPALSESVGRYMSDHTLDDLPTEKKLALILALEKCARLADLPGMLQYMGLEEVTFQPSAGLLRTCDGYTKELIPKVIAALFKSAREGDIPAMLSLIYLLDPGGPGIRVQVENQERESGVSAYEIYPEVHKLAYQSIPDGNLYYTQVASRQLLSNGTQGYPRMQADGSFISQPDRPSFIKGVAFMEALWAIGADPNRPARGSGLLRQLSSEERTDVQQKADELVEGWLKLPVLIDSDIKAQGYWSPDLY